MECFSKTPNVNISSSCCHSSVSTNDRVDASLLYSSSRFPSCFRTRKIRFVPVSPDAIIPCRTTPESVGYNFHSIEEGTICPGESRLFDTAIKVTGIPKSYFLKLESKSGICQKNKISVLTGISDFESSVKVLLFNFGSTPYKVEKHQQICQGIFLKTLKNSRFQRVISTGSEQGDQGFCSSN